jgi:hypothetical protein
MQSLQQGCQVDAAGDPCDLWDRRLLEGTKSGLVAAKLSDGSVSVLVEALKVIRAAW